MQTPQPIWISSKHEYQKSSDGPSGTPTNTKNMKYPKGMFCNCEDVSDANKKHLGGHDLTKGL